MSTMFDFEERFWSCFHPSFLRVPRFTGDTLATILQDESWMRCSFKVKRQTSNRTSENQNDPHCSLLLSRTRKTA